MRHTVTTPPDRSTGHTEASPPRFLRAAVRPSDPSGAAARLDALIDTHGPTPCQDPDRRRLWFSERVYERHSAARRCLKGCPAHIRTACFAAAVEADERYGVWGGVDFTTGRNGRRR